MRLKLLVFSFLFSIVGWGQATLPLSRTTWDITPIGWTDSPSDSYLTVFACSGNNGAKFDTNDDFKIVNFNTSPGELTFTVKSNATTTSSILVQESTDGVSYTNVVNLSGTTDLPNTCTTKGPFALNSSTRFIKWTFTKGTSNMTIDDVSITSGSTSTISITPSSLSGFTYNFGSGPSLEQSFTISGTNLTNNIALTAPTNYEISLTPGSGYTNSIIITQSGGIVSSTTLYVKLKAGLALGTYNGQNITCTSTGATTQNITCNGNVVAVSSVFSRGDFAVIGVNSNIATCNGGYQPGDDEISFITFRDIQNGDAFHITDNGYERASAGTWGDSEGLYKFTRTGGSIPAGTVITFRLLNTSPFVEYVSPDTGWLMAKEVGFGGQVVLNSGGDQLIFTQGGTWTNPGGTHDAVYTPGEYLYAFNTNNTWTGGITASPEGNQNSALPVGLKCFSLMPGVATDYIEYTGPVTPVTKLEWIARLNDPINWTNRGSCAGYLRMHVGQVYSVNPSGVAIAGVWTGTEDTNWFNCSNWQNLEVPTSTVNVVLNSTYSTQKTTIVSTATDATLYGNIATCNNLTISDDTVELQANVNNKLEVHGDLLINATGVLDMDDDTPANDGQLYLYGNWTNTSGNAAFSEGNGTVHFTGALPQVINNVVPEGTETFYNVVMNNNFNTAVSNDLIATGSLVVNAAKTVTIQPNDYVQVNKAITNNGTITIENSGSLVQTEDGFTDTGVISIKRNTNIKLWDYVFWSSPVENFAVQAVSPDTPSNLIWKWNPSVPNPNNGYGNWQNTTENMIAAKGYILRAPTNGLYNNTTATNYTATFTGVPNNGIKTVTIERAGFTGAPYAGTNGVMITNTDDNINLIGNPYPSSINALDFLILNSTIEGAVRLWTHGTLPNTTNSNPFYNSYSYNYSASDFIIHNGTATISGPNGFNGLIGAGQSFLVYMNDGPATTSTVSFNNSLRNREYNNSQFYKNSSFERSNESIEKHRIWLDLISTTGVVNRTVIGYVEGATPQKDRMYDAYTNYKDTQNFYSLIDNEIMAIQGRELPFTNNDEVSLGFKVPSSGNYSIAIATVDGLFSNTSQNIYLEDKMLNIIHDLRSAPYQFTTTSGIHNNRFVLRHTDRTILANYDFETVGNSLKIYEFETAININSSIEKIKTYEVYNVLGQTIASKKEIRKNDIQITSILKNNQILIVKITLENGQSITKKIIF